MPEQLRIAVIGGGCSGALVALHLLRGQRPVRVHLVDPRTVAGTGLAYSTDCPHHLLNVPASRMSVSSSAPHDFVEWLERDPEAFVARALYGRYVVARLEAACREEWPRNALQRHQAEVLDVGREGARATLHLNNGTSLEADSVVLALGNATPRPLPFASRIATDPKFYQSAWDAGALAAADPEPPIVLIGCGLTAVDAFLGLRANGYQGVVHMISRRGLVPQPYGSFDRNAPVAPWRAGTLRELVREVRNRVRAAQSSGSGWRDVIVSLRSVTNELWRSLTPADRERFCRHVKAYWDAHRHRMAPPVAVAIDDARRLGSLQVHAGRIQRITEGPDVLTVETLLRSQGAVNFHAQRIINCTGSEQDYRRVDSPLLQSLFRQGWLDVNAPGVGICTTENGAVVGRGGAVMSGLYAIGPMRIGGLLETTAVPEIREQAEALAKTLLDDQAAVADVRQPALAGTAR